MSQLRCLITFLFQGSGVHATDGRITSPSSSNVTHTRQEGTDKQGFHCAINACLGWLGRVVNRQGDLVVIDAHLSNYYLLTQKTYNTKLFAKRARMNGYHGLSSSSLSSTSPCDGLSEPIAVHEPVALESDTGACLRTQLSA